jgi:hypothetical protein
MKSIDTRERALNAVKKFADGKEPKREIISAISGDAITSHTDTRVTGKNRTYVRLFGDSSQCVEAISNNFNLVRDVPVFVHVIRQNGIAIDYEIVGIDARRSESVSTTIEDDSQDNQTPPTSIVLPTTHGWTHERYATGVDGATAPNDDAIYVHKNAILEFRPGFDSDGMAIRVQPGFYTNGFGALTYFPGDVVVLTAPSTAGYYRWDLVYLDVDTGLLGVQSGSAVTLESILEYPTLIGIPIALVKLSSSTTKLTNSNVVDARLMWGKISNYDIGDGIYQTVAEGATEPMLIFESASAFNIVGMTARCSKNDITLNIYLTIDDTETLVIKLEKTSIGSWLLSRYTHGTGALISAWPHQSYDSFGRRNFTYDDVLSVPVDAQFRAELVNGEGELTSFSYGLHGVSY